LEILCRAWVARCLSLLPYFARSFLLTLKSPWTFLAVEP
jgi:hypothetical protein